MKVVMTLLARDEADIVDAWLAFHLNAGADFVVATDNRSVDGTTEVLERYARDGHVHLIREPGEDLRQDEWVTRMARLAATEFGADWVINSDADEFWWPRGASLATCSTRFRRATGPSARSCASSCRGPDGATPFAERMTVRFSALAPINDPASLYKPIRKVIHRGASRRSGHARKPRTRRQPVRAAPGMVPDRGAFTSRSARSRRASTKLNSRARRWKHIDRTPTAYHAQMFEALESGTMARLLRGAGRRRLRGRAGVDAEGDSSSTRGCETRCDSSRPVATPLEFPMPTLVDEAIVRRGGRRPRARRTSCGCSAASTRSRNASRPSSCASRTGLPQARRRP